MAENHAPREVDHKVESGAEAPKLDAARAGVDMTDRSVAGVDKSTTKPDVVAEDGQLKLDTANLYRSTGDAVDAEDGAHSGKEKGQESEAEVDARGHKDGKGAETGGTLDLAAGTEELYGKVGSPERAAGKGEQGLERKSPEDRSEKGADKAASSGDRAQDVEPDDLKRADQHADRKEGANDMLYWSGKQAREGNLFGEHGNLSREQLNQMIARGEGNPREQRAMKHLQQNFDQIAGLSADGDGVSQEDLRTYFRDAISTGNVAVNPEPFSHDAKVDRAAVDEGRSKYVQGEDGKMHLDPGVLQFGSAEDIHKFQNWLDKSVPPDGTEATNDRRTALVLNVAMADAARNHDNPADQMAEAYQKLNAMRASMRELTPREGFSGDPGIANAEHFLETAHRVAGAPFDGNATDVGGQVLRGEWSAPVWKGISKGYNLGKEWGLIGGSAAGGQHKWERSGIDYGVQSHRVQDWLDERKT